MEVRYQRQAFDGPQCREVIAGDRAGIFRVRRLRPVIPGLLVFLSMAFAVPARADTLHLKNGKSFEGIIIKEGDREIVFDVIMGADRIKMTFNRGEVERVEKASAAEREAIERELVRAGEEREKLEEEMKKKGLILYRGKWVTEDERSLAGEEKEREAAGPGRSRSRRLLAPRFELPDLEGNIHSMDEYRGKLVLLFFWGTWSRPAAYQIQTLKKAYEKYGDEGLVILGISLDTDTDKVRNFVRTRKIDFPVLCDGEAWRSPAVKLYGVKKLPSTFLIDRSGYIRASGMLGEAIEKGIEKLLNE